MVFFYKEDIELVLGQEGVISLHVANATVGGKECKIAIGVTGISKDGAVNFRRNENDFAALFCPPFNQPR